ncbi:hypothetical protein [Pontibacter flavimaris]|uniref:VCBS repeat-containing protein n=1 Tax=Pontibacter flavimaris TaxID=1797110 RepID=A0A1Q5PCM6_9BACT|nr:hypothetical protein [Pontibacter flavimaris]OKL39941.1 hypothetical protein A3841_16370 [Pontibacter flavimaris]
MKSILYLLPLCLLACSPENEQVQDEHVQVAPPAKALDSIADTEKDAVRTDETVTDPTLPLPQPVMQLLETRYPGWKVPEIAAGAQQQATEFASGAAFARGDFDGDGRQDVALQLQQGKEVVIVAALQPQDGRYTLEELKRDILFNERGTLRSLYYLYRLPQGEQVQELHSMNEVELPHDAIAVGVGQEVNAYIYRNGAFELFSLENEE